MGHIKIERNEELYASEYEDHSVEVAIEEGDDVIACDLQGLPMILIRNDEELSVGAECIVSSISVCTSVQSANNYSRLLEAE